MTHTYPAVLRDGRIEWTGEPPAGLPDGTPVQVTVATPPPATEEERRQRIVAAFQRLAERGTAFADISDPVAWQRSIRKDGPSAWGV